MTDIEPDDLTVTAGPPAHGGHIVARHDGRVIFVRHALPGETVRLNITHKRSRLWHADAVEVLDHVSADRVDNPWPAAGPGGVGSGELLHVSRTGQLAWKTSVLQSTVERIGGTQTWESLTAVGADRLAVRPLERGDELWLAARTRVHLTGTSEGGLGMHRYRSSDVVPVDDMPLAVPSITDAETWHRAPTLHQGESISYIAPSDGEVLTLINGHSLTSRSKADEVVPSLVGDLTYRVSATGFWQVHHRAPAALVDVVLQLASRGHWDDQLEAKGSFDVLRDLEGASIVELYSGAGLLTKALAHAVGPTGALTAIEGNDNAVRDAKRNLHDLPQARLRRAPIDHHVAGVVKPDDVVVLDPPRTGAGQELVAAVCQARPRRIVHVACDPAALARDIAIAVEHGYQPSDVVALDLFPGTHHFEVIVALDRPRT